MVVASIGLLAGCSGSGSQPAPVGSTAGGSPSPTTSATPSVTASASTAGPTVAAVVSSAASRPAATITTVTAVGGKAPKPGAAVVLRAVVAATKVGLAAVPTGSVQFQLAGRMAGSAPLVSQGSTAYADLTVKLTGGTYAVVAVYAGDSTHAPSTSAAFSLSIPTSVASLDLTYKPLGTPGKLHIVIVVKSTRPGPVATGSVEVSIDGGAPVELALVAGRTHVDHQFVYYKGGRHTVVVRYPGDGYVSPVAGSIIVTT